MSVIRTEHVFGTKTEEQAHASWLNRAESDEERADMERKIAEYERMRRPIHMGDLAG